MNVLKILNASQRSLNNHNGMISLQIDSGKDDISHDMTDSVGLRSESRISSESSFFIHPTAIADENVSIGSGSKIWHFSHILGGSVIGDNCNIGQNVVIGPDVSIGKNCKIQNNVSVYKGVMLEEGVFCGPSMVFTNVTTPRSAFPRKQSTGFSPTLVQQGASIGANATIVCGHTIGSCALVGAGSVVTKDVPPYGIVYGNPARLRGWACKCGVTLRFEGERATCGECGRGYRCSKSTVRRLSDQEAA